MISAQQKAAFRTIYFTQLWERFSYFGMRALLVLYLVQVLNWSDSTAYGLFGSYCMLICIMPIIGGYLTDRHLGYRNAALYGGGLICIGHLCLTLFCQTEICLGLSFIIVGTGLMLPSLSSLVGRIYQDQPKQQTRAYNLFYMSVNVGGLLAGCSVGFIAHQFGWHIGFGLAAIGMLLGLSTFAYGWRYLARVIDDEEKPASVIQRFIPVILLFAVGGAFIVLKHQSLATWLVGIATLIAIGVFGFLFKNSDKPQKEKLWLLAFLFVCSLCFFVMYEQSGSSLMLFTERVVERHLFGALIPTPVLTSLNPLLIIFLVPLMAIVWQQLANRQLEPPIWIKVAIGLMLTASGFLVLAASGHYQHPSLAWLFSGVTLMTVGELFIGPVMLSAIAQLAPKSHGSTIMGLWFLMGALASYVAAILAKLTSVTSATLSANHHYAQVFQSVGIDGMLMGVGVILLTPILRRLIRH